jgi:hypothetical protein
VVEFEVDGEVVTATPGSFAFVARGAAHCFRVITDPARMLVICSGKPTNNLEDFLLGMGWSDETLASADAPRDYDGSGCRSDLADI